MALKGDTLYFYKDKDFKDTYISIKWNEIVCVNKRQVDRFDIRTVSIHYLTGKRLNELRLKCVSRAEVDEWIARFRDRGIGRHDFKISNESSIDKILTGYRKRPIKYYTSLNKLIESINTINNVRIFEKLKETAGIKKSYLDESLRDSDIEIHIYDKNDKSKNDVNLNENIPFINKKEADNTKISFEKMDMTENSKLNKDMSIITKGKIKVMNFGKNDSRIYSSNK
jgi:hypothetical protein